VLARRSEVATFYEERVHRVGRRLVHPRKYATHPAIAGTISSVNGSRSRSAYFHAGLGHKTTAMKN